MDSLAPFWDHLTGTAIDQTSGRHLLCIHLFHLAPTPKAKSFVAEKIAFALHNDGHRGLDNLAEQWWTDCLGYCELSRILFYRSGR